MPRSRRPGGRGRRKADAPHPVDIYVGERVKERRLELGISQQKLAEALGLTFQQVQKYEGAANRISASRLYRIGEVLGVDVPYFFEGYRHEASLGFAEPPTAAFDDDPLQRREARELLDACRAIADPAMRHTLIDLARQLAARGKPH
jgi:transcriptional regulator with XRE-family HTH domain